MAGPITKDKKSEHKKQEEEREEKRFKRVEKREEKKAKKIVEHQAHKARSLVKFMHKQNLCLNMDENIWGRESHKRHHDKNKISAFLGHEEETLSCQRMCPRKQKCGHGFLAVCECPSSTRKKHKKHKKHSTTKHADAETSGSSAPAAHIEVHHRHYHHYDTASQ